MTFEDAFIDELGKIAGLRKIPLHFMGGMRQGFKPNSPTLKAIIEAVGSKAFRAGYPVGRSTRKVVNFLTLLKNSIK